MLLIFAVGALLETLNILLSVFAVYYLYFPEVGSRTVELLYQYGPSGYLRVYFTWLAVLGAISGLALYVSSEFSATNPKITRVFHILQCFVLGLIAFWLVHDVIVVLLG